MHLDDGDDGGGGGGCEGVGDLLPEIATKSQISFSIAGRHSQVSQGTPDHLTILQIRTADATDAGDTKLRPFFVKQKVKDKLKMFYLLDYQLTVYISVL